MLLIVLLKACVIPHDKSEETEVWGHQFSANFWPQTSCGCGYNFGSKTSKTKGAGIENTWAWFSNCWVPAPVLHINAFDVRKKPEASKCSSKWKNAYYYHSKTRVFIFMAIRLGAIAQFLILTRRRRKSLWTIDVKKSFLRFLFRARFFNVFNVFLFCQSFLFLKTFIENTIWNCILSID